MESEFYFLIQEAKRYLEILEAIKDKGTKRFGEVFKKFKDILKKGNIDLWHIGKTKEEIENLEKQGQLSAAIKKVSNYLIVKEGLRNISKPN